MHKQGKVGTVSFAMTHCFHLVVVKSPGTNALALYDYYYYFKAVHTAMQASCDAGTGAGHKSRDLFIGVFFLE